MHHVSTGHFARISRGFYRLAGVPSDPHEDVVAAWLKQARRRAVVSHETALALYDLAPSRASEIHLIVSREHRPRTPQAASGVQIHTTTVPLGRDEVTNRFGVQITSPARTIADVAEVGVDPSVVMEAAARAVATGLVSPAELSAAATHRSARVRELLATSIEQAYTDARARAQPVTSQRPLAPAPVLRQDRGDSNTHGQT